MFKKSVTDASKLILNFAATTPEIIRAKIIGSKISLRFYPAIQQTSISLRNLVLMKMKWIFAKDLAGNRREISS